MEMKCYIECYEIEQGNSMRLRDKNTNKIIKGVTKDIKIYIDLTISNLMVHCDLTDEMFNKNGRDSILVNAKVVKVNKNAIFIGISDGNRIYPDIHSISRWECYLEEYNINDILYEIRLRDKKTNKKVEIKIITDEANQHFYNFFKAAKQNRDIMPTLFCRNGTDIVAIRGVKYMEDRDTIYVNTDVDGGGYLFE